MIDAPSKVSLFAYDNNSFVVESFLDSPSDIAISTADRATKLRNLATGDEIAATTATSTRGPRRITHTEFHITLQPHSFLAFSVGR